MSAMRDLVAGQGCGPGEGGMANPIAALFSQLVDSTRKSEELSGARASSDLRMGPGQRARVAARAGVHLRHVFPDARPDFLERQVASFMLSIDGGMERPSLADDLKYQEFLGGAPQVSAHHFRQAEHPRLMPHHTVPSSGWATEFERPDWRGSAASGPTQQSRQGSDWAQGFAGEQRSAGPASRVGFRSSSGNGRREEQFRAENGFDAAWGDARAGGALGHRRHVQGSQPPVRQADWAGQFQDGSIGQLDRERGAFPAWPLRTPEGASAAWAQEFGRDAAREPGAQLPGPRQEWAHDFAATQSAAQQSEIPRDWAREFTEPAAGLYGVHTEARLTVEERRAARGPSHDDPLDDPTAPTWVGRYNDSLGGRTINADNGAASALARDMRFAAVNPYCQHPLPLQEGSRLVATGKLREAALAFEAAAQAAPDNADVFAALGRCRLTAGNAVGSLPPLERASQLRPADGRFAVQLAQAALGCRRAEVASRGAERWLESQGFGPNPDAPAKLEDRLKGLIQKSRGAAVPYQLASVLLTLRGELGLAADAAQQAVLLQPKDAEIATQLGAAAARAGRTEAAEKAYSEAVRIDPKGGSGWTGLGRCCALGGQALDAVACHLKAVELAPEAGGVWDSLAMAATAGGHPELAELADVRNLAAFKQRFNLLGGVLH